MVHIFPRALWYVKILFCCFCFATAGQVGEILRGIEHVRLLIVNTPEECVIGGLAPAVEQAVSAMACQAVYLDGVVTVHCDAARPVAEAYRQLKKLVETGAGFVIRHTAEYMQGGPEWIPPELFRRIHGGHFSIQAHVDLHGLNRYAAREARAGIGFSVRLRTRQE